MWIPNAASEVLAALQIGPLTESEIFDAKQALPSTGRSKDLARDVAAMATAGGVLLYGVGEDDKGRASMSTPIELAGAEERIQQIVRSGIARPPSIVVRSLPLDEDPGRGFLVVEVPQSSSAPHMVIVDGDYRYYRRVGTTNAALTEDEVSRIYERRAEWSRGDGVLLDDAVAASSLRSVSGSVGFSTLFVAPLGAPANLLPLPGGQLERELSNLFLAAVDAERFVQDGWDDLRKVIRTGLWQRRTDGMILTTLEDPDLGPQSCYEWEIYVERSGRLRFNGPAVYPRARMAGANEYYTIHEHRFIQEFTWVLKAAASLLETHGFSGELTVGLHIGGMRGAMSQIVRDHGSPGATLIQLTEDEFQAIGRYSTAAVSAGPRGVLKALMEPLMSVLRIDEVANADPYA